MRPAGPASAHFRHVQSRPCVCWLCASVDFIVPSEAWEGRMRCRDAALKPFVGTLRVESPSGSACGSPGAATPRGDPVLRVLAQAVGVAMYLERRRPLRETIRLLAPDQAQTLYSSPPIAKLRRVLPCPVHGLFVSDQGSRSPHESRIMVFAKANAPAIGPVGRLRCRSAASRRPNASNPTYRASSRQLPEAARRTHGRRGFWETDR